MLSIAAVERLIEEGEIAGGFVICGTSLKKQWEQQILKFTGDEANVIIVTGDERQRHRCYTRYAQGEAEYLILNIEQIVNDWPAISKLPRDFVVADEIQFAKNFKPKRSKRLKQLKAEYRWGLTGQPIENRPEDLFSIMQWVDPTVLGNWESFDVTFIRRDGYGHIRRVANLPVLHRTMQEAMVRKTWEDPEVKHQMPAVSEEEILVDFDIEGAKLYRKIRSDLLVDLEEALGSNFDPSSFYMGEDTSSAQLRGRIMSKIMCMRMLCDHPDLLRLSAERYMSESQRVLFEGGSRTGSQYAAELEEEGLLRKVRQSPKLDVICEEVTNILEADDRAKIVVFSYFKDMLKLLRTEKPFQTHHPVLFTGDLKMDERGKALARFREDPECRIFLSSDAGGVGVDIPFANHLISYDLPWSFGAWEQRNARIIRISSEFRHVTTSAILMADSIEQRQYDMLQTKAAMGSAILDGVGWDNKGGLTLDTQSLKTFLTLMDV